MKNLESLVMQSRPSTIHSLNHQRILEQEIQNRIQQGRVSVFSFRTYLFILLGGIFILCLVVAFHQNVGYPNDIFYSRSMEEYNKYSDIKLPWASSFSPSANTNDYEYIRGILYILINSHHSHQYLVNQ